MATPAPAPQGDEKLAIVNTITSTDRVQTKFLRTRGRRGGPWFRCVSIRSHRLTRWERYFQTKHAFGCQRSMAIWLWWEWHHPSSTHRWPVILSFMQLYICRYWTGLGWSNQYSLKDELTVPSLSFPVEGGAMIFVYQQAPYVHCIYINFACGHAFLGM